jgi:signal transduction histidine kinase
MNVQISVSTLIAIISILVITVSLGLFVRNICAVDKTLLTKHNIEIAATTMATFLSEVAAESPRLTENGKLMTLLDSMEKIRILDNPDVYFFLIDINGYPIANGGDPQMCLDASGNRSRKVSTDTSVALVKIAQNGGGFASYLWHNPRTKMKQKKITYVHPVSHTPWILGVGFYE